MFFSIHWLKYHYISLDSLMWNMVLKIVCGLSQTLRNWIPPTALNELSWTYVVKQSIRPLNLLESLQAFQPPEVPGFPKKPITSPSPKNNRITYSPWKWILGRVASFLGMPILRKPVERLKRGVGSSSDPRSTIERWTRGMGLVIPGNHTNQTTWICFGGDFLQIRSHGMNITMKNHHWTGKFGRMCFWNFFLASKSRKSKTMNQNSHEEKGWQHTQSLEFQRKTTVYRFCFHGF